VVFNVSSVKRTYGSEIFFTASRALEKQEKIKKHKQKAFHVFYFFLFSFVFSYFSKAAEGVILIPNSRWVNDEKRKMWQNVKEHTKGCHSRLIEWAGWET